MPTIFEMDPCPTLEQPCLNALQPVWSETFRNLKFLHFRTETAPFIGKNCKRCASEIGSPYREISR